MRRLFIASVMLAVLLSASGCAPSRVVTVPEPEPAPPSATPTDVPESEPPPAGIAWLDTQLTDTVTGEQFRLSEYKGRVVLLHAFAVW
jgi:hypothetical protein